MAAVQVKHARVAVTPNDHSAEVGSDEWNAAHTITGLENVDNTSDVNKPVSTAQAAAIAAGVGSVTKTSLGLGSVDNTSDANKPVSTAQAAANAVVAANAANATNLTSGTIPAARLPSFTQTGTGAVARTILSKLADSVSIKDFGAVCDGVTDDVAAFNAALAAFDCVTVPQGTVAVSTAIIMARANQRIIGAGRNSTIIKSTSAANPVIQINGGGGAAYAEVSHLSLDRSVTATTGGDGIHQGSFINQARIHDVHIKNQYNGLVLTTAAFGSLSEVVTEQNYSNGLILVGSVAAGGTLQWNFNEVLSQNNNGDGVRVQSFDSTNMVLGEPWRGLTTFANNGYGVVFAGSATSYIADINMTGCFLGNNGAGEIYLDTYAPQGGVQATISDCQFEATGTVATGRGSATAASGVGHGIQITANNRAVNISSCAIQSVSQSGIYSSGPLTAINNVTITNSGTSAGSASRNGIEIAAGSAIITNVSTGNDGTTNQQNGILIDAAATACIVAHNNVAYKSGSVVGGIVNNSSTPATCHFVGNIGYTPNQLVGPLNVVTQMTAAWAFGNGAAPISVAVSSSSPDFGTGVGLIVVRENTFDGGVAVFLAGGGLTVLIAQTTAVWGTTGAAGTQTPAASKCSVAYSGTGYRIYNGSTAGARTFYASGFAATTFTN